MIRLRQSFILASLFCVLAIASADERDDNKKGPSDVIDQTVQQLAPQLKKSVVVVTFLGRDGKRQGLGSGFIIDSEGLIATNMHVIGEARSIQIGLQDGRKFDAIAIHATERSHDLAILRIAASGLPALPLGNSNDLQEGQSVMAVGNPIGLERSIVSGVLSARREIEGRVMFQVALPIERGNSGGPLVDMKGRVQGILTLKSMKTENLGFAMPINALKPLLENPNPIPISRWLTIGVLDPEEWTVLPGCRWRQRSGRIFVSDIGVGLGGRALCLSTHPVFSGTFEIAVQVKMTPNEGAAGLVFQSDGADRHYGFYPSNGAVRLSRFDGPDVFSWNVLKEVRSPSLHKSGWNSLKVRVEKDRFLCYLNEELVIDVTDSKLESGRIGLCKFRQTEAEFRNFQCGDSLASAKPSTELRERVSQVVDQLTTTAVLPFSTKMLPTEDATLDEPAAIELFEQLAQRLEQQAGRVRQHAQGLQLRRTLAELQKVLSVEDEKNIDLLRAGLLISKLDNPELDVEAYVQDVERHARRVVVGFSKDTTEQERLASLNRYLFEEQGFHGSRTDYENRSNSYLNEVLDDREGLPITLSVLYMELARRLDVRVVGVGMPRHFIVRHEPQQGDSQLIDVFERGQQLSKNQARSKFESFSDDPWTDSYLNTSTPRAILERMLRNLFGTAATDEDPERMLPYIEAILLLNPESARDRFIRAVICHQTQRWNQARTDVEWLMSHNSELNQQAIEDLAVAIARDSQK